MTDAPDPFANGANPFASIGFEPSAGSAPSASVPADLDNLPPLTVTRSAPAASPIDPSTAPSQGTMTVSGPSPDPFASGPNPFAAIGFDGDTSSKAPPPSALGAGPLSNSPDDGNLSGSLKNIGTTAIKGLAHAPGFVGDTAEFADTLMEPAYWLESKITGKSFAQVMAERQALGKQSQAAIDADQQGVFGFSLDPRHYLPSGSEVAAPILKQTGSYQPQSTLGRYGAAAGEAALGGLGPGGGAMLTGGVQRAVPGLIAGAGDMARGVLQHAVPNASAGLASQAVADRTNDPFLTAMAGMGTSGLVGAAHNAHASGPAMKAASLLSNATDDPSAALGTIAKGNPDALPGVAPTTAELTGDGGLYQLQNQVADNNPAAFALRRAQQDRGRLAALDALQPGGDPGQVASFFSQHFDDIGDRTQAIVDGHLADAQSQADALRGQGLPTDAYGATLRSNIADAEGTSRQAESRLWGIVDPENKLTNDTSGIKSATGQIYGSMPAADQAFMSPAEHTFAGIIGGMNDVEPFRQVASLKSNLASAMRQELRDNGRTPAYGRLAQLMSPVQDAINGTVERRATADNAAVAVGQMAPADTLASQLRNFFDDRSQQRNAGEDIGAGAVAAGAGRASSSPSGFGTSRQGDGQPRVSPGPQTVPRDVPGAASQADSGVRPVYYPGGVLGVRHELAEHGSLITSHDADFRPRDDYPQNLQPRARDSAGAQDQVSGIAARLQPDRLGPSPEANSGSPIVGPDNVVESGNGRTLAIGKAYDYARAAGYRQHLENLGFDTTGYDRPVLVGRRVTSMTPDQRESFTHAANGATSLRMGSAEQASADARTITPTMLDAQTGPNIASAANRPFVNAFMSKLSAAERGALVDQGGNLSQAGVRRIQAAMAAHAYGDHGITARAFDDAEPNIKGLAGALMDASGPWAKMRAAVADGSISPDHDITPELTNAVKLAIRSRDENRPLGEVLRQGDLFNSDTSRLVSGMLTKDGERLASRQHIEAGLRAYAEEAMKNAAGDRLFGEAVPVSDVLRASQVKAARETGSAVAPEAPAPVFSDVPPSAEANYGAEAAARYQAANAASKERAQTFGAKPISDILAEAGGRGNYKMPASSVPGKLFTKGPGGFENIQAFRRAVGNDEASLHVLRDHALDDMRKNNLTPDSTLSPDKLDKWRADHADALRAFPDLDAKFRDAAAATRTYEAAAADRRNLIKNYEKSIFGKLMNASHPNEVNGIVGAALKSTNSPTIFRKLTEAASSDPMALAGLRQSVLDHIVDKSVADLQTARGPERTIKAKAFGDLVKSSRPALEQVLGKPSTEMLSRIANSLPLASRAVEQAGRNHADLVHYLKAAAKPHESLLERMVKLAFVSREVGETLGGEHGGMVATGIAAGGMVGKKVIDAIRASGARKVGDLISDAVLNPEQYSSLMQRAPIKPDVGSESNLALQLRRASMFGSDALSRIAAHAAVRAPRLNDHDEAERQRPQRAAGGRVEPTEAQKQAGNYEKRHVGYAGLPLSIENEKGSQRRGVGKDGKPWSVTMPAAYGYIRGTAGADGDHVDCYLGPKAWSPYAFVIDQVELPSRKFDEEKVMLGFATRADAVKAYEAGFSDGKGAERIGKITPVETKDLKYWAATRKSKPERARGGGILGVPTYGQMLGPTKKAMGFGFADGGTVLPDKVPKLETKDYHDSGDPVAIALSIAHGR